MIKKRHGQFVTCNQVCAKLIYADIDDGSFGGNLMLFDRAGVKVGDEVVVEIVERPSVVDFVEVEMRGRGEALFDNDQGMSLLTTLLYGYLVQDGCVMQVSVAGLVEICVFVDCGYGFVGKDTRFVLRKVEGVVESTDVVLKDVDVWKKCVCGVVGGLDDVVGSMLQEIWFYVNEMGKSVGLLCCGLTGVGKSLVIDMIAKTSGFDVVYIDPKDIFHRGMGLYLW